MTKEVAAGVRQRMRQVAGRAGRAVHGAYYYLPVLHRQTEPLLILGHMRCGSTLLAHIINSNAEVAGYGETHRSYRRRRDLWGLRAHVFVRQPTLRVRACYVTDKNVNEIFSVEPAVLARSSAHLVMILREPRASLSSLLDILPDWTEQQALDHYLTRMDFLQRTSRTVSDPNRTFFLTHYQLLQHSEEALRALTQFLQLGSPLTSRYEVTDRTGQWGWGDTSERVWAGDIVRDYARPERNLPADMIRRAELTYHDTVLSLQHSATHAPTPFLEDKNEG